MVVHAYYPLGETRVQREAEELARSGYAVDVICLRDKGESQRECHHGVEIHRLRVQLEKRGLVRQFANYLHFGMRATIVLTFLQLRHHYHSVQVHNLPDCLVFCAAVPKLQHVPIVLDLHDLMPEFLTGRFGTRRRTLRRLIGWQERIACRFADHVITVSEHWRDALLRRGVPSAKCSVVMNVADNRIFRPVPARAGSANGRAAPDDEPRFSLIYHGTVTHRYGLDLAMEAVALLRHDIPGIRLTILGRGDFMPALAVMQRDLDLEQHVVLRDECLPAEQLPELIARADLGIVPYRNDVFTDGLLPTKLMEYAAMGIPCVATRTTAIEHYFRDTMVAFFTPGDAHDLARRVRDLYESPEQLRALASRSRRFVDRYNWPAIGEQYVALVDHLGCRDRRERDCTQRAGWATR
jgi:glycosyltransferase involved in cell wall biosynthesis